MTEPTADDKILLHTALQYYVTNVVDHPHSLAGPNGVATSARYHEMMTRLEAWFIVFHSEIVQRLAADRARRDRSSFFTRLVQRGRWRRLIEEERDQ